MENLEYSFTEDWFSRHIPAWSKLLESLKPSTVLEIGSYEGRSACFLIEACTNDDGLSFYCVDTWEGGIEHDGAAMAAVERRFDHNIEVAQKQGGKARARTETEGAFVPCARRADLIPERAQIRFGGSVLKLR